MLAALGHACNLLLLSSPHATEEKDGRMGVHEYGLDTRALFFFSSPDGHPPMRPSVRLGWRGATHPPPPAGLLLLCSLPPPSPAD